MAAVSSSTSSLAIVILLTKAVWQAANGSILDPFEWARSDRIDVNIPWLPFENETRCYDDLGCLNITRSWYHLVHRPFNVFPLPRDVINTRFLLYTRDNPTEGKDISAKKNETIAGSGFSAAKPTKFILHGFIDTPLSNWVAEMRGELLKAADANVIVVDWAGGSLPLYTQATANTRLVGLEVAHLIKHLQNNFGLKPQDVHLIGHSLGAHTAGYAGAQIPGLARITGLDPAEPFFQGMPPHVRLDPTDAQLVDVIHTDGKSIFFLGYGMSQPCGHLDFYPNNGKEQPGCELAQAPLVPLTLIRDGLEEASRVLVACNHVRAIKLFTDSINSQCSYVAHVCSSYQHFMQGKCFNCMSGGCSVMGYHADGSIQTNQENEVVPFQNPPGTKYYLATAKEYPYCQRHYRISLHLARPSNAEKWVQGVVKVTLQGDSGVIHDLELANGQYIQLEHGTTYSEVVTHPVDLAGKMRKVEVRWEYDLNVLEPRSICLFWCNDHLYLSSISVHEMVMGKRGKRAVAFSSKLCSNDRQYVDIANRGKAVFYDSCSKRTKQQ